MRTLTEKIDKLGFPMVQDVTGMGSIQALMDKAEEEGRCGIYLLVFANGHVYIGKSIDVAKRYLQHARRWADIVGFTFLPIAPTQLDSKEKDCIERAERLAIPLQNSVFVSSMRGKTKFDTTVSLEEQRRFLGNPRKTNIADKSPRVRLPKEQLINKQRQFESFLANPLAKLALTLLKIYVNNCLPFPCRSEYSFWSLTCMPSYSGEWRRMAVVNAGGMELCVLFYNRVSNDSHGFVNVSKTVLMKYYQSKKQFLRCYPDVYTINSTYQAAGQDQIQLRAEFADMLQFFKDDAVVMAAADLALRAIRKRTNLYKQAHCQQLADLVLPRG